MPLFDKNGKEYKAKLVPRRERPFPRVISTNFPKGLAAICDELNAKTFVPLEDFRKLERKYFRLFQRQLRRNNNAL